MSLSNIVLVNFRSWWILGVLPDVHVLHCNHISCFFNLHCELDMNHTGTSIILVVFKTNRNTRTKFREYVKPQYFKFSCQISKQNKFHRNKGNSKSICSRKGHRIRSLHFPFSPSKTEIFLYHMWPCIFLQILWCKQYIECNRWTVPMPLVLWSSSCIREEENSTVRSITPWIWWRSSKCFHSFIHQNLFVTAFHAAECFVTSAIISKQGMGLALENWKL